MKSGPCLLFHPHLASFIPSSFSSTILSFLQYKNLQDKIKKQGHESKKGTMREMEREEKKGRAIG
jgi:hypothetical protein